MRNFWAAAALFAGLPTLWALEGKLFFTLAPNITDEFCHIMPYRFPFIPTVGRCVRKQQVTLVMLLANPAADKDGKVLVEAERAWNIEPDGRVKELVEPGRPVPVLQGVKKGAQDFSGVMLSGFRVILRVEEGVPLGKMRINIRLRDRGDDSVLELSEEIEAAENLRGASEPPMSFVEMSDFLGNYYRKPEPEKIPAAFAAFLKFDEENVGQKKNYDPLMWLCGFAELYKLNPHLRPALVSGAAAYSVIHKQYAALILADAEVDESELEDSDPELRRMFDKIKGKSLLRFGEITNQAQLDALWMSFFTTGKFEPIRRLVHELRKRGDEPTAEAGPGLDRNPAAEKSRETMIGRAALCSLASNACRHKLVGYYLESILMRREQTEMGVMAKLGGILVNAGLLSETKNPDGKSVLRPVLSVTEEAKTKKP